MAASRIDHLRSLLSFSEGEALILSVNTDIRWATGFTGSSGAVLLTSGAQHLFTDGRYKLQSEREATACLVHVGQGDPFTNAVLFASNAELSQVQLQLHDVSQSQYAALGKDYPSISFRPSQIELTRLRAVKDESEVNAIVRALTITEKTLEAVLPTIREGMTEIELAAEIDYRQRLFGAERSSFETIVAFGQHSELPHARPGASKLKGGEPILLDFGCVVDGYASDMTRTVHFGSPSSFFFETYSLVRQALNRSVESARSGMTGSELDSVARKIFTAKGVGEHFSHSLGHGVGLDIHEWPSISSRNAELLPSGSVITIEPGLYIPNHFGIRIENMILLSPEGSRTLNSFTTELQVL